MSSPDELDTRFSLPAIDDPPDTEVGVILMGLDAERLLAGLGMATLAEDPALVALTVDHARHDATMRIAFDDLIDAGCHRWRSARETLTAATPMSASLRAAWAQMLGVVAGTDGTDGAAGAAGSGPASRAYLAACLLRRNEVDQCMEDRLCHT